MERRVYDEQLLIKRTFFLLTKWEITAGTQLCPILVTSHLASHNGCQGRLSLLRTEPTLTGCHADYRLPSYTLAMTMFPLVKLCRQVSLPSQRAKAMLTDWWPDYVKIDVWASCTLITLQNHATDTTTRKTRKPNDAYWPNMMCQFCLSKNHAWNHSIGLLNNIRIMSKGDVQKRKLASTVSGQTI